MALVHPKNIRREIRLHVGEHKFPLRSRPRVINILVRAIRYYRIANQRLTIPILPTPAQGITGRPRGRPKRQMERNYLISEIFRAWVVGFGDYPVINNKLQASSKFVRFAEPILQREGIGKILTNLEQFRAYRKQVMQQSGFRVVRGKVF